MRTLIGVAWPYASGPRHLGHLAGVYLPADVAARYHRLVGDEVLVVSGSDQHGTPVTIAAEHAGVPVAEFANAQHDAIVTTFARLGITFDHYTKTTTATHARVVQDIFAALHRNGFITEGEGLSAWCPAEDRALPDRYVNGTCPNCADPAARGDQCDSCGQILDPDELLDPRCRLCGGWVELRLRRQLFLRLDLLQPRIAEYVHERTGWRRAVARETAASLAAGLVPRAITRDLDWGIAVPLPGWDARRLYVWFDAVIGYLSATIEWAEQSGNPESWRAFWQEPGVRHRYFIGKDNTWFHTLWWPAILIGSGGELHLPDEVVASQYLTEAGGQLSTSRGHGTTIDAAIERLGVDRLRHALCALSPERADTEFSWDQVDHLTRTGLLGAIANPVHRVATLLWHRFSGAADPQDGAEERPHAADALAAVGAAWEAVELRRGTRLLHDIGRHINRSLAETEPWHQPDHIAREQLGRLIPWIDALAVAAWPVVPGTAERIRSTFGRPPKPSSWQLPAERAAIESRPAAPLQVR